jgi:hypothetical protein
VRGNRPRVDDFHAHKQLHHENLLPLLGFSHEFVLLPAMVSPCISGYTTAHSPHILNTIS